MYENISQEKMNRSARLSKVQSDLLIALKEFPSEHIGVKSLATKMLLSQKTLTRILKGSHSPTYQTILKIYRYLTATSNDRETVMKMPELLAQCVISTNENFSLANESVNFLPEISFYLKSDSVFRSIYIETAAGKIHKDKVGFEHGTHGLKVLSYMKEMNVIQEVEPDIFTGSTNRASLDTESLHQISRFLLDNRFSPDKCNLEGENSFQVLFDGIDVDTYNEILKIDWEAKQKKLNLVKNAKKGDIKFWSISYTDTLSENCIYDNSREKLQ